MRIWDGALHRSDADFFQGSKFIGSKSHLAAGKSWFWFQFAMGSNKTRGLSQLTHEKSPGRRLHVIYVSRSRLS